MKKSPYGKGYNTCLCFLIECPNYINQFCIVLLAALSCKKEFFLNTEIFCKISENYWWGNCPMHLPHRFRRPCVILFHKIIMTPNSTSSDVRVLTNNPRITTVDHKCKICIASKVTGVGTLALPKTEGQLSIYQQGELF